MPLIPYIERRIMKIRIKNDRYSLFLMILDKKGSYLLTWLLLWAFWPYEWEKNYGAFDRAKRLFSMICDVECGFKCGKRGLRKVAA